MTENKNGHTVEPSTVKMLTVNDILTANDITEEVVEVPEWGGAVRVRAFTKAKQQQLRVMATDPRTGELDSEKLELQLFIHGVIDPEFQPIQATELRSKSAGAVDRVLKRIMAISGLSQESVREATKSVPD